MSTDAAPRNSSLMTNGITAVVLIALCIKFPDIARGWAVFLLTLGILIAVHEWGHFIAARAAGVRVYEFALGLGPKLFTYWRHQGTDYTIRAFPLGGFVNLKGMQPDDPITPDGVNGRRPAERALVYLSGPLMNAILGTVVFLTMGWAIGTEDQTYVLVGNVERKEPASQMEVIQRNGQPVSEMPRGLRVGDHLLEVNGIKIDDFGLVADQVNPNPGKPVDLLVERGRDTLLLRGTAKRFKHPFDEWATITAVPKGATLAVLPGDQLERINSESIWATDSVAGNAAGAESRFRELSGKPVEVMVWRNKDQRLTLKGLGAPISVRARAPWRTKTPHV